MSVPRSSSVPAPLVETLIVVCFLALAAWFVFVSSPASIPPAQSPAITAADITFDPVRRPESDRPTVTVAGFEMNCMECHALFRSRPESGRRLTQHQYIVLDHGLNDRCFNCHDNENRSELALRGGRTVHYTQVARLCAKCHGPTYRDWQKGLHGRTTGSWVSGSALQRRLKCSECHDPHAPAFDPFRPLPGPNTLRMGRPHDEEHGGEVDVIDPLRHWQTAPKTSHPPIPDHGSEPAPGSGRDGETEQ